MKESLDPKMHKRLIVLSSGGSRGTANLLSIAERLEALNVPADWSMQGLDIYVVAGSSAEALAEELIQRVNDGEILDETLHNEILHAESKKLWEKLSISARENLCRLKGLDAKEAYTKDPSTILQLVEELVSE